MRALTRWNPLRGMTRYDPLFGDIDELFNGLPVLTELEAAPTMRIDVSENEAGYLVKAEIPGVTKEDIAVSVDGNVVAITAEVKREKEEKEGEKVLRSERYFGSVSRTLTLPTDVMIEKAEANYDKGVLTLTLPKAANAEAKRLPVH